MHAKRWHIFTVYFVQEYNYKIVHAYCERLLCSDYLSRSREDGDEEEGGIEMERMTKKARSKNI